MECLTVLKALSDVSFSFNFGSLGSKVSLPWTGNIISGVSVDLEVKTPLKKFFTHTIVLCRSEYLVKQFCIHILDKKQVWTHHESYRSIL